MSEPNSSDRRGSEESVPRVPPPQYPPPSAAHRGQPPPQSFEPWRQPPPQSFEPRRQPPPQSFDSQRQAALQPSDPERRAGQDRQSTPVHQQYQSQVPVPNPHWVLSVIAVLLSIVFGGVALYFSFQVSARAKAGNMAGAAQASKMVTLWGWIGIGTGVVFWLAQLG